VAPLSATSGPASGVSVPKAYSEKLVGQILRNAQTQLQSDLNHFYQEATKVVDADTRILQERSKLKELEQSIDELSSRTDRLESSYKSLIESQDEALEYFEKMEIGLLKELQDMGVVIPPGGFLDSSSASASAIAAASGTGRPEDRDREEAYRRAQNVTLHLSEAQTTVQKLLAALSDESFASGGLARGSSLTPTPMSQIVRVLDGQMRELQTLAADVSSVESQVRVIREELGRRASSSTGAVSPGGMAYRRY
jgi:exonuclease VII large subunit